MWVDNTKMDIREIGLYGLDLTDLTEDRVKWRAFVNKTMHLRGPIKWKILEWLRDWQLLKKGFPPWLLVLDYSAYDMMMNKYGMQGKRNFSGKNSPSTLPQKIPHELPWDQMCWTNHLSSGIANYPCAWA
jgi:hypothetical protein